MKEARRRHCAVTIDDKIYAIGGEGQYGQSLSSIECYNADKWVLCRQMLGKRFLFLFTKIKIYSDKNQSMLRISAGPHFIYAFCFR